MSVLAQFGVSSEVAADLSHQTVKYNPEILGRTAHIDADFIAYQVSAESAAELDPDDPTPRKTYADMQHNAYQAVEHIRRLAQAEYAVLHTTHDSAKGGRDVIAIQKEYQATRKGKDKPQHLDAIRLFLGQGVGDQTGVLRGVAHVDQEADDGMAQAMYADPKAILCSADKDLLMVPGLKLDMQTYVIYSVDDPFGSLWIREKTGKDGKVKRDIKGNGTKWFWAQLLMGDQADNIQGLPECPGSMWQEVAATQAYTTMRDKWIAAETPEKAAVFMSKLKAMESKTKLCGGMLAYALLESARTDKECYETVKRAYTTLASEHGYVFKHWMTDEPRTATKVLLSEMQLLWMRRTKDKLDVLNWLKEVLK